jgi:hypothetical protein
MGILKGQKEYKKFKEGELLTRREAILAMCYECNGLEESNEDCQGKGGCPLYQYHPHRPKDKKPKRQFTQKQLEHMKYIRSKRPKE